MAGMKSVYSGDLQQRPRQNLRGQKTSVLSKKVISNPIKCHKTGTLTLTFGIYLRGSNHEVLLGGVARLLANWLHPVKTGRENRVIILFLCEKTSQRTDPPSKLRAV